MRSGITDIDEVNEAIEQHPGIVDQITCISSSERSIGVSEIMKFQHLVKIDGELVIKSVNDALLLVNLLYLTEIEILQASQLFYIRLFFEQFLQTRTVDDININEIKFGDYIFELKNGMMMQLGDENSLHGIINQEIFDFFVAIKLTKLVVKEFSHANRLNGHSLTELYYYPVDNCESCSCDNCQYNQMSHDEFTPYNTMIKIFPALIKLSLHPDVLEEELSETQVSNMDDWRTRINRLYIPESDTLQYLHFPIDADYVGGVVKSYPNLKEVGIGYVTSNVIHNGEISTINKDLDAYRIEKVEKIIREDCASLERIILFSKYFDDKILQQHLVKTFPKITVV